MWVIERLAKMDFETFSCAGFILSEDGKSWKAPKGSIKKGISAVGSAAYAEHPSTEVLTLSWKLPGDNAVTRWKPGQPLPQRLFDHIAAGGLIEAHNSFFERLIWQHVCTRLYGWPPAPPTHQWRCSSAKARVNNLPGALGDLTQLLPVAAKKDADGKRLLNKFSVPQKPTKKDPRTRIRPEDDPEDGERLELYCDDDIYAEEAVSGHMMPMSEAELAFWLIDQDINWRGIGVDMPSVRNMISILEQAQERYGEECQVITGGLKPGQVQELRGWLAAKGVFTDSLDAEAIEDILGRPNLPPEARRVVEIRSLVGSASVKKLYAMERTASRDERIRNIIIHHGARTGRPTGDLVQPLNLPKAGPDLIWCGECGQPSKAPEKSKGVPLPPGTCPWCWAQLPYGPKVYKWGDLPKGMDGTPHIEAVLEVMATRSLEAVEHFFGDALLSISGCVRGMFIAGPGCDLIASDYSAIEAVVTAALAGCEWRLETFRRQEDIYLHSAAKIIPGRSYQFYQDYKAANGSHHPDRQKTGKVAELALGFGGWVGGWRGFDESDTFTDDEVKKNIVAWREASPEIVEMWGGQERGRPWASDYRLERFGFEGAFINAVQYPAQRFTTHGVHFYMRGDALIIQLLSGRELTYHSPRLYPSSRANVGEGVLEIVYMTWNSNPKYGPMGWVAMKTYAGRIAENIVQATAHDIQRYGITALQAAGYPIVLHVYDENVAEVAEGFGSIEEFEAIMATMPPWAAGWPIRASGGWRGKRYRKG